MKKLIGILNFGNISTDFISPTMKFFKTGLIYPYISWHKISKLNKMSNFLGWFLVLKIVFWKNHYWVATTTDCFKPIFGFLGQFCFENIALPPGTGSGCFHSSQNAVRRRGADLGWNRSKTLSFKRPWITKKIISYFTLW